MQSKSNFLKYFVSLLLLMAIAMRCGYASSMWKSDIQLACNNTILQENCDDCVWEFVYKDLLDNFGYSNISKSKNLVCSSTKMYMESTFCFRKCEYCLKMIEKYASVFYQKLVLFFLVGQGMLESVDDYFRNHFKYNQVTVFKKVLQQAVNENCDHLNELKKAVSLLITYVSCGTNVDGETALLTSHLMVIITSMLTKSVTQTLMSCEEAKKVVNSLLICSDMVYDGKLKKITYKPFENSFETIVYQKSSKTPKFATLFLENVQQVLRSCLPPGEQEIILETKKSFFWIKRGRPDTFINQSKVVAQKDASFRFSQYLGYHLDQGPGLITVQFVTTKNNLFWFESNGLVSKSNLISLTIERESEMPLKTLPYPIDLYFKYNKKVQSDYITRGFANLFPPKGRRDQNTDDLVTVFKLQNFQHPGNGMVSVRFHNISYHRFKVLLQTNLKPDYNSMNLYSSEVSINSPLYQIRFENQTEEDEIFIGILPIIKIKPDEKVPFNFEVRYYECYSRSTSGWNSKGCFVGEQTSETVLHCQCWHLSIFGGRIVIVPRIIDLSSDIYKLIQLVNNPHTFIYIVFLWLLYFIMLVWTRHNDEKDRLQRVVIVCDDNFPGESWAYLITVYTGIWIGSGTDANVGVRLYGSRGMSRVHNLQSPYRKVLKANCDDWFLIFSPLNLGEILKIQVFHDHIGESPDWYCSKIMVYDLGNHEIYKFVVKKWFCLQEHYDGVEWFFYPTPLEQNLRRDMIAVNNAIFGIKETHLLASIFTRHPRSSVTRSQRLSILVCFCVIKMLTMILFYDLKQPDFPAYSENKMAIIIDMESSFLASPFNFIAIFCFKKSRIVTAAAKPNVQLTLMGTQAIVPQDTGMVTTQSQARLQSTMPSVGFIDSSESESSESSEYEEEEEEVEEEDVDASCFKNCYYQIHNILFQVVTCKPVMPVRIAEEDEESAHIRKIWKYFAWIICESTIFVGSFLIIMYSLAMDASSHSKWLQESRDHFYRNICITTPLKIMVFCMILAVLYGRLNYIASYECNFESAMNTFNVGNTQQLSKILRLRKNNWYRPLSNAETVRIRNNEKNWRRWKIVINFIVILLMFCCLMFQTISSPQWYFPSTQHFVSMFGRITNGKPVTDFESYKEYLLDIINHKIDKHFWYNESPVMNPDVWTQDMGVTGDYRTRLIGIPRIRQIRVKPNACNLDKKIKKILKISYCNAQYSKTNLDDQNYKQGWIKRDEPSFSTEGVPRAKPFLFTPDYAYSFCSQITKKCYNTKGYELELSFNEEENIQAVDYLFEDGWFDSRTRAVFVELLFYNVETKLISFVNPILERFADGRVFFHVQSVSNTAHASINLFFIMAVISTMLFYYLFRMTMLFNRLGLTYLISLSGILDLLVNIVVISLILTKIFVNNAKGHCISDWHHNDQKELRLTEEVFSLRRYIRYQTAIMAIIIPLYLIHSARVGKRYLLFFKIWSRCMNILISFVILIITFYIVFLYITIFLNKQYTILPVNRIFSPLSFARKESLTFFNEGEYFSITINMILNLLSFMLCITFAYNYRKFKKQITYYVEFNMLSFIKDKTKIGLNIFLRFTLKNKEKEKGSEERLRSGADKMDKETDLINDQEFIHNSWSYKYTKQIRCDLDWKLDYILKKLECHEE